MESRRPIPSAYPTGSVCISPQPTQPQAFTISTKNRMTTLPAHWRQRQAGEAGLWADFLDTLTGGDVLMEHALKVWTAAALFDGNPHHKAHILYGDGNTGKSTFLKTIQAAFGDYAGSARASVFTR